MIIDWFVARAHSRAWHYGLAVLLVAAIATSACMSSDNDDGPPEVVMSTLTPVPPGWSPTANPTIVAARTQIPIDKTATAVAQATAAVNQPTPNLTPVETGEIVFPTPPSNEPNTVYPPASVLVTLGRYIGATIGSYNWFEQSLQSGASVNAPWIDLTEASVITVAGATAELKFDSEAPAQQQTLVEVFTMAGNAAIPSTVGGEVGDRPAFIRQTPPSLSVTLEGANLSFTLDVPPGEYIVVAHVTWPMVPGLEAQGDQKTDYAYRISVQ